MKRFLSFLMLAICSVSCVPAFAADTQPPGTIDETFEQPDEAFTLQHEDELALLQDLSNEQVVLLTPDLVADPAIATTTAGFEAFESRTVKLDSMAKAGHFTDKQRQAILKIRENAWETVQLSAIATAIAENEIRIFHCTPVHNPAKPPLH